MSSRKQRRIEAPLNDTTNPTNDNTNPTTNDNTNPTTNDTNWKLNDIAGLLATHEKAIQQALDNQTQQILKLLADHEQKIFSMLESVQNTTKLLSTENGEEEPPIEHKSLAICYTTEIVAEAHKLIALCNDIINQNRLPINIEEVEVTPRKRRYPKADIYLALSFTQTARPDPDLDFLNKCQEFTGKSV